METIELWGMNTRESETMCKQIGKMLRGTAYEHITITLLRGPSVCGTGGKPKKYMRLYTHEEQDAEIIAHLRELGVEIQVLSLQAILSPKITAGIQSHMRH